MRAQDWWYHGLAAAADLSAPEGAVLIPRQFHGDGVRRWESLVSHGTAGHNAYSGSARVVREAYMDPAVVQLAASGELCDPLLTIPTRLRWPLLPSNLIPTCQLLRAPRALQPAANLYRNKSASSTSSSTSFRAVHHSARYDEQQLMMGATGTEFEGLALFTAAATKKMTTKSTTTTETCPPSKNCCSLSCKSRATQRRIGAQTRRGGGGVEEVAADERGGSVDQSRSAQCDNLGGSLDDPIALLGNVASEAEAEAIDVSLCAESATAPGARLFDSLETAPPLFGWVARY
ncbi:hypothetical protein LOCC1_G008729 [Lachnellula occidentalis]|uniref:Uncharacterized protein n=1 Tax=Lachnellula occidentalis TaxID=215460 RepID=A0A8H8RLH5_9HELO|nr:hypothetical protein LOCC1_G008729 [Lachnellula occidentalis]